MNRNDLRNIKGSGKDWYESYASMGNNKGLEVIITPSFYPNPLDSGLFIYEPRFILDMATQNALMFFESAGIKSMVSGPTGLGVAVSIPVSAALAIFRFSIQITAYFVSKYRNTLIKKAKPSMKLELSLCIQDSNNQLNRYARQFVVLIAELIKCSNNVLPYINLIYVCSVNDMSSGKSISFNIKDANDLSILKQLRKIDKTFIVA